MAKSKVKKHNLAKDPLMEHYIKICGSPIKAQLLEKKYTKDEAMLFLYEIKSQQEALDTENLFDIGILEQLADLHIQMNRILFFQKELLDEAEKMKISDQPGDALQVTSMKLEAAKLTGKWAECNDKCKALIATLNQERVQRAKQNQEQKISFTKIVKDLDDIKYKERVGKHGALLQKSKNRKKSEMVEQGLILVYNENEVQKQDEKQEEKTEEH